MAMFRRAHDFFNRLSLRTHSSKDAPQAPQENRAAEPEYPPPPPAELLQHRASFEAIIRKGRYLTPKGEDDNSLYSLYRLYENIVLDRNIGMRNEIEYFFRQHWWAVADIPDPKDSDPMRYAVLACIPHLLVLAFNQNIELGLPRDAPPIMTNEEVEELKARTKAFESVPEWTKKVPALEERFIIPYMHDGFPQFLDDMDDVRASAPFRDKNILLWQPHIYFI
ncbi:MAG: hypothetical protein M4579_001724 [Chaenotheca gracillima]|nr:MAG: hypothetical protein M4579_001724 [Chaenotheca gracillima]